MDSLQGMNMDALVQSVSVIVRMLSNPPDGGSFVMKSIAMVSNGLAFFSGNIGDSGGCAGLVFTLVIWHVAHPLMYSVTKVFMFGHQ
jgi:hypothetical protein